jgi:pimeloyl-ACP methyl ester carboxylesterase
VVEHYDAVIELLHRRYRVVCWEMPGFGFSRPARGFGFTPAEYERVTEELLDDVGLSGSVLAFPCVWGYVALRLAARRPDLVRGLVLAQAPHWSEEVAWAGRLDRTGMLGRPYVGQLVMAVSSRRVARDWYRIALPRDTSAPITAAFTDPAVAVLRAGGLFCLASLTQAWFGPGAPSAVEDRLLAPQPAVLMWGVADRSHRRSDPESALAYLPAGRVVPYADGGHFPELERPERLRDALALIDGV